MDVFDDEGIDPSKVVIAHTGDTDNLEYIEELLSRGCYIGMDRYGIDLFLPIEPRNATVIELCKRGHAEKMMLSQDYVSMLDWFPAELITQTGVSGIDSARPSAKVEASPMPPCM